MQELAERIAADAIHVGGGILKVDSFINHQVDSGLMRRIGEAFAARLGGGGRGITRVVTAEVGGIAPALATAQALDVPLVYARKRVSKTMTDDYYRADVVSRTRGDRTPLWLSKRFLGAGDRVLLIDDFLATGSTLEGLLDIVAQSGAALVGIGCIIEKPAEQGRERLGRVSCPVVALASVTFDTDRLHVDG